MAENIFPQAQQIVDFWTKAAKNNVAAFETAIETSVVATKAGLGFATQMSEQWGKVATETARRFTTQGFDSVTK